MNVFQLLRIIWARRALTILSTIIVFGAAVLAGRLLPPRYTVHSRVLLDVVKPDPVTGQVINSTFARAYVKTQTELITDYRVAGRVVDALGWTSNPQFAAQYALRDASDKRDFRRWLAQIIIDRTDPVLVEGSNILDITYTGPSGSQSAIVADALRKAYVEQVLDFKREDAERNGAWFRSQADRLKIDLAAAEKRKADFERANGIILADDTTDTETKKLEALAAASVQQPSVTQQAAPAENAQLAQADAAIAEAQKVLGPNNPDLIKMHAQRDALAKSSKSAGVARAVVTGPSIASQYSAQQAKVLAQRDKVGQAQQLAADVAVLRDQYNKTAARAADLGQQSASDESGLTLLGSAVAPSSPTFPNWPLIIIGSLALGIGLGIAASLVTELMSRRVRGPEDLRLPDVPVIGVMPLVPDRGRRRSILERLGFWSRLPRREGAMA